MGGRFSSLRLLLPINLVLLCLGIMVLGDPVARGADRANYDPIDRHALTAPSEAEQSLDRLAAYLVKPARDEKEKVRAIFRWMTDRISYDVESFFQGVPGELRPEGVLWRRRAVCSGYTALFDALCRRAGLTTATINGYAKGFGYHAGQRIEAPNHAWSAVKLDGRWQLLDVTWASGFLNEGRFVKRYRERFFLMPPEEMVLTHFPVDVRWQLLSRPLTMAQFETLPKVDSQLFELGIPSETVWQMIRSPGFPGFVKIYAHDGPVKIVAAPLAKQLAPGREYLFVIDAPAAYQASLINNGRWVPLRRNGSRFEGVIRPEPGDVKLGLQRHPADRVYQMVLDYQVLGN